MNRIIELFKTAGRDFIEDDCMSSGAAIAYYTIFSLPPLLAIVFMVTTSLGFSEEQVSTLIKQELGLPVSDHGQNPQSQQHSDDSKSESTSSGSDPGPLGLGQLGTVSKIVGALVLLFSAAGVFGQLQFSLNKAWEVKPDPKQGGIWNFLTKRVLSIGMVVVIGFLLLVSLVVTTVLDEVLKWIWGASSGGQVVGLLINELVAFAAATVLFATMFKVLPDARIRWADVWAGAAVTALLFVAGKFLIGWYLESSHVGSDWGTSATSVIGALVWVYYSSLIVLYGAELTQVRAKQLGHAIQPVSGAEKVVIEERAVAAT